MHRSEPAHDGVIANLNMTSQSSIVREHNRVADCAIMTDVTIGEKISAVAHTRLAVVRCAAINRAKLTKSISVANFQISWLARVFQILRLLADRTIRVKSILASGPHRPGKGDMMLQPAFLAEHDVTTNNAIRTHNCSCAKFRF